MLTLPHGDLGLLSFCWQTVPGLELFVADLAGPGRWLPTSATGELQGCSPFEKGVCVGLPANLAMAEALCVPQPWLCLHGVFDLPTAKCMYVHAPDIFALTWAGVCMQAYLPMCSSRGTWATQGEFSHEESSVFVGELTVLVGKALEDYEQQAVVGLHTY